MILWTEWTLATRFLLESRLQSLLILLGIAIGCAVIVFLSALISALQDNLIDKTLGSQAHIRIESADERNLYRPFPEFTSLISQSPRAQRLRSIAHWQALVPMLDRDPHLLAVSPLISGPALVRRAEAREAVSIIGIELERYRHIIALDRHLSAGQLTLLPGDALIGYALAEHLGLRAGDKLRLEAGTGGEAVVTVRGIFNLGVRELDERYLYLPLKQAQSLLALPGAVSSIELKVADIFQAEHKAQQLAALTGHKVQSWMQSNSQLLNALRSQSLSTDMIQAFIAISVVFGIASVLAVSVVQRTREIGILRAMGATRGQILRVFLIQGALLGGAGALLGCLLGAALLLIFAKLGPQLFAITLNPSLFVLALSLALIAGIIAAIIPARRAAGFDPAVAIRYV